MRQRVKRWLCNLSGLGCALYAIVEVTLAYRNQAAIPFHKEVALSLFALVGFVLLYLGRREQKQLRATKPQPSVIPREDEAEVALLALGDPLKWSQPNGLAKQGAFVAHKGDARYLYSPVSDSDKFCAVYARSALDVRNWVRREYPTLEAAKAACERHDATGQWE